jgi:hypothetical protein
MLLNVKGADPRCGDREVALRLHFILYLKQALSPDILTYEQTVVCNHDHDGDAVERQLMRLLRNIERIHRWGRTAASTIPRWR